MSANTSSIPLNTFSPGVVRRLGLTFWSSVLDKDYFNFLCGSSICNNLYFTILIYKRKTISLLYPPATWMLSVCFWPEKKENKNSRVIISCSMLHVLNIWLRKMIRCPYKKRKYETWLLVWYYRKIDRCKDEFCCPLLCYVSPTLIL